MKYGELGFTLLEMMLVVAIVGILASLAMSYTGKFSREESLKEAARYAWSALAQGRSYAMKSSTKTTVNFNSQNFYVFVDSNNNEVYDNSEMLIFKYPTSIPGTNIGATLLSGVSVTSTNATAVNSAGTVSLKFDYQGYSIDSSGNPLAAVICITDTVIAEARSIELTMSGSARIQGGGAAIALGCPL